MVPYIPARVALVLPRSTIYDYYRDEAEEVLRPLRKFADHQGWKVREAHATGPAAQAITVFAEAEKPDLIVMGTHGHSSLTTMVLGSVASGVLARCKVPVLLIH